jgi:hypothetical protein
MALSEEEKKKIEEEEEYRAKLRGEKFGPEKKKSRTALGCFILLLVIFAGIPSAIAGVFVSSPSPSSTTSDTTSGEERKAEFKTSVNFTGTQFVFTNLDDYDCIGSLMSVNNKYSLDGYTLEKGQIYTFEAGEFTEGDNVRFNPYAIKPASFSIICRGNNELSQALWTGQF